MKGGRKGEKGKMSENTGGKIFAERVNGGLKVAAREQTEGRRGKKK